MPNDTQPNITRTPSASPRDPAAPSKQTVDAQKAAADAAAMPVGNGVAPKHDPNAEARPVKPPQKPTTPEQQISQRLALISRRESSLVQKQRSWQAEVQRREAALKNRQDELDALKREVEEFRAQREAAKTDPLAWLKFGGHTYDAATQAALNDGKLPADQLVAKERERLESQINELRQSLKQREDSDKAAREQAEKDAQERQRAEQQKAYEEFFTGTVREVKEKAQEFPLITLFGKEHEVPQLIDAHFRATAQADVAAAKAEGRRPVGKILSTAEAAGLLESHYREKMGQLNPGVAAQQPQSPVPPGAVPEAASLASPVVPQSTTPGQRPTISNAVVTAPSPAPSGGILSEKERYARALAMLNNAPTVPSPR